MKYIENHVFTGMQRDLDATKHPVSFLYEGRNIRLTARDGNTLMAISNEKGTVKKGTISGDYLGHCLLNKYLVIFTTKTVIETTVDPESEEEVEITTKHDCIYRVNLDGSTFKLYDGDLGFNTSAPIDAIASYESENIQKVYWTDGLNSPRVINIANNDTSLYNDTYFDFIPELKLQETIAVLKINGSSGVFAPGVIQYAFTYYRKYGQESNIFYISPLMYVSHADRGAAPDDKVSCSFKIEAGGIDNSSGFNYVRIYSIQRTSLNGTPIVKRVQDIEIGTNNSSRKFTFIDNGNIGETIDPFELLYKGGESITAKTLEQKDNTLFLGNLIIKREHIKASIQERLQQDVSLQDDVKLRHFEGEANGLAGYQLSMYKAVYDTSGTYVGQATVPCGGFKFGDVYRCGVQFQYKTGKWSDPIYLQDFEMTKHPSAVVQSSPYTSEFKTTIIKGQIPENLAQDIKDLGYIKVRAVVVFPEVQDRNIICQGVANPILFRTGDRNNGIHGQSSWFFRAKLDPNNDAYSSTAPWDGIGSGDDKYLRYYNLPANPTSLHYVELQDRYFNNDDTKASLFQISYNTLTLHSPEIEFGDDIANMDFSSEIDCRIIGWSVFNRTLSDCDIQTETPVSNSKAAGFNHIRYHNTEQYGANGIVTDLLYNDYTIAKYSGGDFHPTDIQEDAYYWPIHLWQQEGSLNNDIERPSGEGTQTSKLQKKIISNKRVGDTSWLSNNNIKGVTLNRTPFFFSEEGHSINMIDNQLYYGNIDTSIIPKVAAPDIWVKGYNISNPSSWEWYETWEDYNQPNVVQIGQWDGSAWVDAQDTLSNEYPELGIKKSSIRMKYKSTPHIVISTDSTESSVPIFSGNIKARSLYITELYNDNVESRYGGTSKEALMTNTWIPCGEPVRLDYLTIHNEGQETEYQSVDFEYTYGDTYFQRYDCLKTYPYSSEDLNQLVEIGSFMLETHINMGGRYDRNQDLQNNNNITPQNFNLINPVYSQKDNFFSYKIMDDDYYNNITYPNQITWSKEKGSGADVDLWTNITMASTYGLDGSKGEIRYLNTWKDQIYCFQDKGICNILFNSRVQIPASDGVPIEISNNYKVDGIRYIIDGVGCEDFRLISTTPSGMYFIDSVSNHLFRLGEDTMDITVTTNMSSWFKDNSIKKVLYDNVNKDVYIVQDAQSLCFSERLNQFTSFMDYDDIHLIESWDKHVFTLHEDVLWKMFEGPNNIIFDKYVPYQITFVSNGSDNRHSDLSKMFTNLEFRATIEEDGEYDENTGKFTPTTPFDKIEVWNDYQHGLSTIINRSGHNSFTHGNSSGMESLKRKFRIWRCDIPRDNADYNFTNDAAMGIYRTGRHPMDRMYNPWLFIKLSKGEGANSEKGVFYYDNTINGYHVDKKYLKWNSSIWRVALAQKEFNIYAVTDDTTNPITVEEEPIATNIKSSPHVLGIEVADIIGNRPESSFVLRVTDGSTPSNITINISDTCKKSEINDLTITYFV